MTEILESLARRWRAGRVSTGVSTCTNGKAELAKATWQVDLSVLIGLLLSVGIAGRALTLSVDDALYTPLAANVWFQADSNRVIDNQTSVTGNHYRNKVHPLFSLMTYPVVKSISIIDNDERTRAPKTFQSLLFATWAGALFVLLRLLGISTSGALIFAALGCSSASAIFWFAVPETYGLGSLSIIGVLIAVAWAARGALPTGVLAVASAFSLSVTVTNWMAGLAATFAVRRIRTAVLITVLVFVAVAILAVIQKLVFPSSGLFFFGSLEERIYVLSDRGGSWVDKISVFFVHSMVMPAIGLRQSVRPFWDLISVQRSGIGTGSAFGYLAAALWVGLLIAGTVGLARSTRHRRFAAVLSATLAGQLVLHLVYGEETFLYSLHFLPLLVVIAAFGIQTRLRWFVLGGGVLLCATALANNLQVFANAQAHVVTNMSVRDHVRRETAARPDDIWPRGRGHVVLSFAGTMGEHKSYFEPGGSFSPVVGSFGLGIWVTDQALRPIASGDTYPEAAIEQEFLYSNARDVPSLETRTPHYTLVHDFDDIGKWRARIATSANGTDQRFWLVLRSVGPAGGPVQKIDWSGTGLTINDRWIVEFDQTPLAVRMGDERKDRLIRGSNPANSWADADGWGYAAIELPRSAVSVSIQDKVLANRSRIYPREGSDVLKVDVPDSRFSDALRAQIVHLRASLVGDETRPGEPINYPLQWLRDGAYVVVALASAGHLEAARRLARQFAEKDFFGGFGSEADAPGLAIWAVEEVAARLKDPQFDAEVWPHIERKARIILMCMSSDRRLAKPFHGPAVPSFRNHPEVDLVCDGARGDGWISGRMDWHRPLFFVNAVSYLGLRNAAAMAQRLGRKAEADSWLAAASSIQTVWQRKFAQPRSDLAKALALQAPSKAIDILTSDGLAAVESYLTSIRDDLKDTNNPRTFVAALWPTWVASTSKDRLEAALSSRWRSQRGADGAFRVAPEWTYFDIAEAHQWLRLEQPEKVWPTLRWFFEHQASPGLYSWWEGSGESNTFHLWEGVRGWIRPPHVTPHYWSAAEMLLLQTAMLVHLDESGSAPRFVIGAGVPREWLDKRLDIRNVWTKKGPVSWTWEKGVVTISIPDANTPVTVAKVFGENAKTNVVRSRSPSRS